MDWVEFTGDTVAEAQDRALDALGVGRDEADFEVVEEPTKRLLGLVKREARVRARVRPTAVRPKQDRRARRKRGGERRGNGEQRSGGSTTDSPSDRAADTDAATATEQAVSDRSTDGADRNGSRAATRQGQRRQRAPRSGDTGRENGTGRASNGHDEGSTSKEQAMSDESAPQVSPHEVRDAAVTFMDGLIEAFGLSAETTSEVEGTEIDVAMTGPELGLLVGPGGRTLAAVQDLVRVASQRRLGDHDTRLRIDVGGYREKRRGALEQFTRKVAQQVMDEGAPKALEPMPSADRKVVHDVLNEIDGVASRSEGDDPRRRVVIEPA